MPPPEYDFATLPDYLRPGLDLVFLGINPSIYSVARGHYFARGTNRFWKAFSRSKLSHRIRHELGINPLTPENDADLPRFGIGLADVVKRPTAKAEELTHSDFSKWVPILVKKLHRFGPRVACFHGLTGYRRVQQHICPGAAMARNLGEQQERIGTVRLYVVPNPSGANAHCTPADLISWYDRLADYLKT